MALKRGRPPKATKKLSVDFTGVVTKKQVREAGQYTLKVAEVAREPGPSGADYLKFTFEVTEGKYSGAAIYDNISLDSKALWKFKSLLDALGMDTDGEVELELSELVGLELGVVVKLDDSYDGTPRAKVVDYISVLDEEGAEEETEEAEEAEEEPEEEAEEEAEEGGLEISEDDVNDMDEEELVTLLAELGIKKKLVGSLSMKRKSTIAALKAGGFI